MTEAREIAGMKPWACSYMAGGAWFGITLYATDPDQLECDWSDLLPGFRVDGLLVATEEWK